MAWLQTGDPVATRPQIGRPRTMARFKISKPSGNAWPQTSRRASGLFGRSKRRQRQTPASLRPLEPGDSAALDQVFSGLSARSRYLRFHAATPALTGTMRDVLLAVDGRTHVAVVAEAHSPQGRRAIGIGRFVRTAPGCAELAVAVVDAWHGRGIGGRLLEALRERAADLGYHELHAEVLIENTAILALLHRTFPGARLHAAGPTGTVVCPVGSTSGGTWGAERVQDHRQAAAGRAAIA